MFKAYLVITIYTIIACIICHVLDNRLYFRNKKENNFKEAECKPKITKSEN